MSGTPLHKRKARESSASSPVVILQRKGGNRKNSLPGIPATTPTHGCLTACWAASLGPTARPSHSSTMHWADGLKRLSTAACTATSGMATSFFTNGSTPRRIARNQPLPKTAKCRSTGPNQRTTSSPGFTTLTAMSQPPSW